MKRVRALIVLASVVFSTTSCIVHTYPEHARHHHHHEHREVIVVHHD